tara:strand:- start:2206 stop:3624 length:1419 start_codon:yes stop_codon:yes gene_type:complete
MTCAYSTFVVFVWLTVVLTVPAAIGCTIAALSIERIQQNTPLFILLPILTIVFTLWTVFLRMHSQRVLIRAGAWPALFLGDRTPRVSKTGDELRDLRTAVLDMRCSKGRVPTVVGSGWGFFLKKSGPKGPRLFMHKFKGPMPSNPRRWASGTTIATVQRSLQKQKLVLPSTPTMDYITLGSWFAMANHGNGSAPGMGKSDTLVSARVLDMQTNTVMRDVKYAEIRKLFDSKDAARYVIIDVELKAEEDVWVQKKGILVNSPETAAEFLEPGAKLRVLFAGAARDYGLGVIWRPKYEETDHIDPHFCSRYCLYFQADIFSAVFGWHESMKNYRGKTKLSDATRWMPAILPIEMIGAVLLGVTNFEIIVENTEVLNGDRFWDILSAFIDMQKELGGRCEFRTTGTPGSKLFIDMSLMRGFERPFELLKRLGFQRCALHPGKFIVESTRPLQRVTLHELSGGSKKPTVSDVLNVV